MDRSMHNSDTQKGPKNLSENYRPVSITSIICKLMESIIRDKIVIHMERNNLFSQMQHGFVPLRNCMTNLLMYGELDGYVGERISNRCYLHRFCKSI